MIGSKFLTVEGLSFNISVSLEISQSQHLLPQIPSVVKYWTEWLVTVLPIKVNNKIQKEETETSAKKTSFPFINLT